MHPYAKFLWSANPYTEADLILPDSKRIHHVRTSSGTRFTEVIVEHTVTPTPFYKSILMWNGAGWTVTLKDGTVYIFGRARHEDSCDRRRHARRSSLRNIVKPRNGPSTSALMAAGFSTRDARQ